MFVFVKDSHLFFLNPTYLFICPLRKEPVSFKYVVKIIINKKTFP